MPDTSKKQAQPAKKSPDQQVSVERKKIEQLEQELAQLHDALTQAQEKERRAIADYHNLQRRTQSDAARLAKFASKELMAELVQPLEHLSMAAAQLQDKGLQLVIEQFWQVLSDNGLREYNPLDEQFTVETMEAVEREGDGNTVIKVLRPGYLLHGEVIQHAKVVVGSKTK
jgi:molecular chaperone GrpE